MSVNRLGSAPMAIPVATRDKRLPPPRRASAKANQARIAAGGAAGNSVTTDHPAVNPKQMPRDKSRRGESDS